MEWWVGTGTLFVRTFLPKLTVVVGTIIIIIIRGLITRAMSEYMTESEARIDNMRSWYT